MVILISYSNIITAEKINDINSTITTMMEKIKNKQEPNEITDAQLENADPNIVLSILESYEKNSDDMVKRTAYREQFRLAQLQPYPKIKQEVVKRLIKELFDPNSNINPYPYGFLLKFKAEDFDQAAKDLIRQNLKRNNRRGETIMLVGIANITEEQPCLEELLIDELAYQQKADKTGEKRWCFTLGWYARLALARMGVPKDINKCVTLLEEEIDIEIDTGRNFRLFEKLGYIRQPGAIESLKKYLMLNERFKGTNPGMQGEPIANYVNDILTQSLANYPIKRREDRSYTEKEIELARKWISEQKEWKIIR